MLGSFGAIDLAGARRRLLREGFVDLTADPTLRYRQHHERDWVTMWSKSAVPRRRNAYETEHNADKAKNQSMLHWLIRREPRRQPRSCDADDDAIRGRQRSLRIIDRLVDRRKHMNNVQHDVDGSCNDDDKENSDNYRQY